MKQKKDRDAVVIDNCVCGGQGKLQAAEGGWEIRCEHDTGYTTALVFRSVRKAASNWNTRQQYMDNLARDSVCAYHSGQSYGKYIAGLPLPLPAERCPKKDEVPGVRCINCNMLIPANTRSKKYCGPLCAESYRRKQKKLRELVKQEDLLLTQAAETPTEA